MHITNFGFHLESSLYKIRSVRIVSLLTLSIQFLLGNSLAYANPSGGQVVAGQADIQHLGGNTNIHQHTQRAIINWNEFSLDRNQRLSVSQPNSSSALLNRVTGYRPSHILGQINANGQVFLLNPNGVLIGRSGTIDAAGFTASTLGLKNSDFMSGGDLTFKGGSTKGVQNYGIITAAEGDVFLFANTVENAGSISASKGVVGLAAGSEILLSEKGDQRVVVRAGKNAKKGVTNKGQIQAAQVELKAAGNSIYEMAINQEGVVRASGVEKKNGRVLLTAGAGQIKVSGEITARNKDKSGGEIKIGGGYQGKEKALANARTVEISKTAKLNADAENTGDGGTVIVWSDGSTDFQGRISARGGERSGDGGFVEVSGGEVLKFAPANLVDVSATSGKTGTLLLDPDDLTIVEPRGQGAPAEVDDSGAPVVISAVAGSGPFVETPFPMGGSEIERATLEAQLASANVVLQADGTIRSSLSGASLSWTSGNSLTLEAGLDIHLADVFNAGNGSLNLLAGGSILADREITAGVLRVGSTTGNVLNGASFNGALTVGDFALDMRNGNFTGMISATHTGNSIDRVLFENATSSSGDRGSINIHDTQGNLSVSGQLDNATAVHLVTEGDLTLNAGASIGLNNSGSDIVLASKGGAFTNNAGTSALNVDTVANQRFLIYSNTRNSTTLGGLTPDTEVFTTTFDDAPPSSLAEDGQSRIFYRTSSGLIILISADGKSRLYGDANPELTFSVAGLEAGDTFSGVTTGTADLTTTASVLSNVGTYGISAALGSLASNKYQFEFAEGTLTVNKAILTAGVSPERITYGDRLPEYSFNLAGLKNGDTATDIDFINSNHPDFSNSAGSYNVVVSGTSQNYTIVDDGLLNELTIAKRSLSAVINNGSRIYGDSDPEFSASFSGFVLGDDAGDLDSVLFTTPADLRSDVGTYAINGQVIDNNYDVTFTPGMLSVEKADLNISLANASRIYGDANPTLGVASVSGLRNGDSLTEIDSLNIVTVANATSDAGDYTITGSGMDNNYNLSFRAGNLNIEKAELRWEQPELSKEYGDTLTSSNISPILSGFKNDDSLADLGTLQFSSEGFSARSNVGNYDLSGTLVDTNYILENATVGNSLTVTAAPISISDLEVSKTYGDSTFTLTNATVEGLKNDETLNQSDLSFTSAGTIVTADAGLYSLSADVINRNYQLISPANGELTVNKRGLTGFLTNRVKTYGDPAAPIGATLSNFANGDTINDLNGLVIDDKGAQLPLTDAGIYTTTASLLNDRNYELASPVTGSLRINPRGLSVVTSQVGLTYGDAERRPEVLVFDPESVLFPRPGALTNVEYDYRYDTSTYSAAGKYENAISISNVRLNNSNYFVNSLVDKSALTIFKRRVTIVSQDREINVGTRVGPGINYAASVTSGSLAPGESAVGFTSLSSGGSDSSISATATDSFTIQSGILDRDGQVLQNPELFYDFTAVDGRLTVLDPNAGIGVFSGGIGITPVEIETKSGTTDTDELVKEESDLHPKKEDIKINGTTAHLPLTFGLMDDLAASDARGFGKLIKSNFISKVLPHFKGGITEMQNSELGRFLLSWSNGKAKPDTISKMIDKYPLINALLLDMMPEYILDLKEIPDAKLNKAQTELVKRLDRRIQAQRKALATRLAVAISEDGKRRVESAKNNVFKGLFGSELHGDSIAEAMYQQTMSNQQIYKKHAESWATGGAIGAGASVIAAAAAGGQVVLADAGYIAGANGLFGALAVHNSGGAGVVFASGMSAATAGAAVAIVSTAALITVMAAINQSDSDNRAKSADGLLKDLKNPSMSFRDAPSELMGLAMSELLYGGPVNH